MWRELLDDVNNSFQASKIPHPDIYLPLQDSGLNRLSAKGNLKWDIHQLQKKYLHFCGWSVLINNIHCRLMFHKVSNPSKLL